MMKGVEGRSSSVGLSKLRIDLLRQLWLTATLALTDTVGDKAALDALKPYFVHHGKYIATMVTKMGVKMETPLDIFNGSAPGNILVNRTRIKGELRENGVVYTAMDCATKGRSSVACICQCKYVIDAFLDDASPGRSMYMTQCLSEGDPCCSWAIAQMGRSHFHLGAKVADLAPPPVSKEDMEGGAAILGEYWAISTRSFVDMVGMDKALNILRERQQALGAETAPRIITLVGKEKGTETIERAMRTVGEAFGMIGEEDPEGDGIMGFEISACPFSGAPVEVCQQYQAFLNGVISAIEPRYQLSYDRMMTKGDSTCHWAVRKKGLINRSSTEAELNDPIKRLTNKFIDGEISEEEFDRKIAHLRKHGIVK